jgi:hypothetical protein
LSGCASVSRDVGVVREALVAGDQDAVDTFTRRFLSDGIALEWNALNDERFVSRAIILRVDEPDRISQYGIDRVSEYFICLLQIKFHTASGDVLPNALLQQECGAADHCDACNSLTYPLPVAVRDALKTYWSERLKARGSIDVARRPSERIHKLSFGFPEGVVSQAMSARDVSPIFCQTPRPGVRKCRSSLRTSALHWNELREGCK